MKRISFVSFFSVIASLIIASSVFVAKYLFITPMKENRLDGKLNSIILNTAPKLSIVCVFYQENF